MSKILGIAGRKQAGKDTLCIDLINKISSLSVRMNWADKKRPLVVERYAFADPLKKIAMDVLGLSEEQCYGTNEQKNTLTPYKWCDLGLVGDAEYTQPGYVKSGYMTAREVLQHLGSNIFRRIYNDIWVDTTIRTIQKETPDIAIIPDVRFPNEVKGIKDAGGLVIYLTRCIDPKDTHISETALLPENFDHNNFNLVVDNQNITTREVADIVYHFLLGAKFYGI